MSEYAFIQIRAVQRPFRGERRHVTVYTSAERGEWGTMPYRRQFYIPALDGLRALAVLAVFAYHLILFWLPLIAGGIAFASLRRDMPTGGELASCAPAIAAQTA